MYWVIQANLYSEDGHERLLEALSRREIPHSVHKVVPFAGTLDPEVDPKGPTIVMGTYTLANIARARGWLPGSFHNENLDFEVQKQWWGSALLNFGGWVGTIREVPDKILVNPFFIRPTLDSKSFSGRVMDGVEFSSWRNSLIHTPYHMNFSISPDIAQSIATPETRVLISKPKEIYREYRLWIVDKRVVAASGYKMGTLKRYDPLVDGPVVTFAEMMADLWSPARAYCMDIADTPMGLRIVEVNNINSAGWYASDTGKIVEALESMEPNPTPSSAGSV